jgi:hypothetical protein
LGSSSPALASIPAVIRLSRCARSSILWLSSPFLRLSGRTLAFSCVCRRVLAASRLRVEATTCTPWLVRVVNQLDILHALIDVRFQSLKSLF